MPVQVNFSLFLWSCFRLLRAAFQQTLYSTLDSAAELSHMPCRFDFIATYGPGQALPGTL